MMRNCETELWVRASDRPVLLGVWCHQLTVKCDPIDWFKLWHHRLTCYSLTWSGYHSHRRADQWISSLCGHRTQTSPPRSVIWPLTIKMKMRSVASVNLLNGSMQDDMGFLGLWSWRNFSDETEWAIIKPTILSNQQSCHICIWNDEWYTGIKICVFFCIFFSDFTELKGSIGWLLVWHWACFRLGLIYAPTVKERRWGNLQK